MTTPATSEPNWPMVNQDEPTPLFEKIIHLQEETPVPTELPADEDRPNIWSGRHPGVAHFQEMFKYDHLSDGLHRQVSQWCANLAEAMVETLPDGPELTAGLRSLWEAKNSFVVQAARFNGEPVAPNKAGA